MVGDRRGRCEMLVSVLRACSREDRKTSLFREANMNFAQGDKYLSLCLEEGLVDRDGDQYILTRAGCRLLRCWDDILEVLPDWSGRADGARRTSARF